MAVALESFHKDSHSHIAMKAERGAQTFFGRLLTLAPFFKHPSFDREDERRIIINSASDQALLSFAQGLLLLVPYVRLAFPVESIVEVIIGPTLYPQLALSSVQRLARREELSFSVVPTNVPYRPRL